MKVKVLVFVLTLTTLGCKKSAVNEAVTLESKDTIEALSSVDTALVNLQEEPIRIVKKHELTPQNVYVDYDGGNQLSDFFQIEVIDRKTFLAYRDSSINYLNADTTSIKK